MTNVRRRYRAAVVALLPWFALPVGCGAAAKPAATPGGADMSASMAEQSRSSGGNAPSMAKAEPAPQRYASMAAPAPPMAGQAFGGGGPVAAADAAPLLDVEARISLEVEQVK